MTEYRLVVAYAGNSEFSYEIREVDIQNGVISFTSNKSFWVDGDSDFDKAVDSLRKEFEAAVAKPPISQEYDRVTGGWVLKGEG